MAAPTEQSLRESEAGSVSRPFIVRIIFVDDVEAVTFVDLVAGHDAVFAVDLEERDRDHQGAGKVEGVVFVRG